MNGEEGFLARWSRRKREATAPAGGATPVPPDAAAPERGAPGPEAPASAVLPSAEAPPQSDGAGAPVPAATEPEFDPASLPPVDGLTAETDISAFLRPGVPAALRGAALRRMWSLDPAIREFVGPADYAWDYNAPGGVPGFALDLGEGAKRLLARAIGLGEEPEERTGRAPAPGAEAAPGPGGGGGDAPAAAVPGAAETTVAAAPGSAAEVEHAAAVPALSDASAPVAAEPVNALPDPAEPAPLARRHGGALPV